MLPWTLRRPPPHRTALAMIGARAGDRVVFLGADAPELAAAVARVTGLNGRLLVVDNRAGAADRVARAAAREGALVDFAAAPLTAPPQEAAPADVVVIVRRLGALDEAGRGAACDAAAWLARPGGRLIVIEGEARRGWRAALGGASPRLAYDAIAGLLRRSGWPASRLLADAEGMTFVEAIKPRQPG